MFVEIGVLEHLGTSLCRIARALGKSEELPAIPHLNTSKRKKGISPEAAARFRQENALVYKVYDYTMKRIEDIAT